MKSLLILSFIYLIVLLTHLLSAPYTKVEESFNIQAIYDLLETKEILNFDHLEFSGVVKRSFIGPLIITGPMLLFRGLILKPFKAYFGFYLLNGGLYSEDQSMINTQIMARLILLILNYSSTLLIARALIKRYPGKQIAHCFLLLNICQFHFNFYASRTLANTFAVTGFQLALYFYINLTNNSLRFSRVSLHSLIAVLSFTICVFRVELALLGSLLLLNVSRKHNCVLETISLGLFYSAVSIAATVLIDSYYWQEWTWPELDVFIFNGVLQKSSEWGTQPFHYYITNALPRIAPVASVLSIGKKSVILAAGLVHVLALSFVWHKEWRFVVYLNPILNITAARTISKLKRGRLIVILVLIVQFTVSSAMLYISSLNYPGGLALSRFNSLAEPGSSVHLDPYTCMTGATLFLKVPGVSYNKSETLHELDLLSFDYLIHTGKLPVSVSKDFKVVDALYGYGGLVRNDLSLFGKDFRVPVGFRMSPLLRVYKKRVLMMDLDPVVQDYKDKVYHFADDYFNAAAKLDYKPEL